MQRVSIRTFALMVGLFIAVVTHQFLATTRAPQAKPDAVWLEGNGRTVQQTSVHCTDCNS